MFQEQPGAAPGHVQQYAFRVPFLRDGPFISRLRQHPHSRRCAAIKTRLSPSIFHTALFDLLEETYTEIMSLRPVNRVSTAQPAIEGAGVHLRRAFGFGNTTDFDPFLLLDDFRNDIPEQYANGFPWHPHRGIETITYVLAGTV